jgi:tetratricopeptide (TPR) repeat protein
MRRVVGFILVVALAGAAPVAAAPTDAEASEAKRHYAQGSRYYDLAEYEEALREFKEAYRIVDDPAFLFNIAQCHRKLGRLQDAITFYRTYLRRAPHTPNRAEVERIIAETERGQAAQPAPAAAPGPSKPAAAEPQPSPALSAPTTSAATAPVLVAAAPAEGPAGGADTERPFYRRVWFWVAAGAVLAGAGAAAFFVLRPGEPGSFCRDCTTTVGIDPR